MRTMQEVFTLGGHTNTVSSLALQAPDPQIISGRFGFFFFFFFFTVFQF